MLKASGQDLFSGFRLPPWIRPPSPLASRIFWSSKRVDLTYSHTGTEDDRNLQGQPIALTVSGPTA